jgi:hypothetical protein
LRRETTAALAVEHGFTLAAMGTGGLQDVMGRIAPEHSRLLRLSGEERVDLSPPPGVMVEDRVTYASVPGPMPVELARLLSVAALPRFIVLLHSGAAARHFIQECARLGLSRARITAITIGPRVTEICHNADGWHSIHTAKTPGDAAMLALARKRAKAIVWVAVWMGVWPNNERRISQSAPRAAPVGLRRTDLRFCDGLCAGRGRCRFASWQLGWLRHGAMPMMSANGPTLNPMGEAQINARIAELDRKLGAIETQAALAGGQAGRAEALLVSIATRRAIERGPRWAIWRAIAHPLWRGFAAGGQFGDRLWPRAHHAGSPRRSLTFWLRN